MFGESGMSMMLTNALKAVLGPERQQEIMDTFGKMKQYAEYVFNGVGAIHKQNVTAAELATARHNEIVSMLEQLGAVRPSTVAGSIENRTTN